MHRCHGEAIGRGQVVRQDKVRFVASGGIEGKQSLVTLSAQSIDADQHAVVIQEAKHMASSQCLTRRDDSIRAPDQGLVAT